MKYFWILILFSATPSFAASVFTFDFRSDVLVGAFTESNNASLANPNNRVYFLPSNSLDAELKPSLQIKNRNRTLKTVIEPRLKVHEAHYDYGSNQIPSSETRALADYGFWQAYQSFEFINSVTASIGIINLQWGPSDILSPSQFMFPELLLKPDPFQSTQGLEMATLQWIPSQTITTTLLAELDPFRLEHSDVAPQVSRVSKHRTLLRGEYASTSGEFTIGSVLGLKHYGGDRFLLGSYSMWSYSSAAQLYYDIGAQQGTDTFPNDSSLFTLALIGHRFTFKRGLEWRIEYIYNDFGLSASARQGYFQKLRANPLSVQYLSILNDPNTPFPGEDYLYNSLRWDNPPFLESIFSNSHIFLRDIFSVGDSSQLINLGLETSLSDRLSHSIAFVKSIGQDDGELSSLLDTYLSYYLKFSF